MTLDEIKQFASRTADNVKDYDCPSPDYWHGYATAMRDIVYLINAGDENDV